MRRIKFKPKLADSLRQHAALFQVMAAGAPPEKREAAQAFADAATAQAPKRRKIIDRMDGVDIDAIHRTKRAAPRQLEAPVVAAISELLAVHPRVLFAVRQNSGMASYEAKSGRYAPVYFYRLLRHGKEVTITDFWGILRDGRMLAVEAKAPGWTKPRTDREMAQANFLDMIRNVGGIGIFATSVDDVEAALRSA